MTYNVHGCVGSDGLLDPSRIASVIAATGPDVVALQELDVGRSRSRGAHQAEQIAEEVGMRFHFHPAFRVAEEEYGDAILARHPLELVRAAALPTPPSRILRETRGALWARVEVKGCVWQVITSHFGLGRAERFAQAKALLGTGWIADADTNLPVVVLGDFNSRPGGRAHRMLTTKLRDAQLEAPPHRHVRTFATSLPFVCVDHILVGAGVNVSRVEVPRTILTRRASDHYPLIADLEWSSAQRAS